MPLYHTNKNRLVPIAEKKVSLERDLQRLTEANLQQLFGLTFVATEFQLHGLRIDTLAYDPESGAFVIIEYKRGSSFSVVDQGYAYLALMLNNKAEFLLEYNERTKKTLKRDDVDWSQSRVVFIADAFSAHQRGAINFRDIPMELWEVQLYEGGIVQYAQIESPNATESIKTINKDRTIEKVSQEVKKFTVEEHFPEGREVARELYEALTERVRELDPRIEVTPVKYYIGMRVGHAVFVALRSRKTGVKVNIYRIAPGTLTDPRKLAKYEKNSMKYYNVHEHTFDLTSARDLPYAVRLIEQAYDRLSS